jgi:hypothetical protein
MCAKNVLYGCLISLVVFVADLKADSIVISQTGPGTNSWTTGLQESNAVSWISTVHYANVSISVPLIGTATGTAYLTNAIGPGTTMANVLATTSFTENSSTLQWYTIFNHLNLSPGTYFLVLGSQSACCSGWGSTPQPSITTAAGINYNGSYFASTPHNNTSFYPASVFSSFEANNSLPLQFSVTGIAASSIPEPSTLLLLGGGLCVLIGMRNRVRQRL